MLVKFGGGILDASGKLGGNVFARNRYGSYVRGLVGPINPNSERQQAIRSKMQSAVEAWRATLTAAERAAWEVYAAAVNWTNRLGETIHLSGYNHFIRSAVSLLQCSAAIITDGPTELTLPEADETMAATISEATQLISVAFDTGLDWVGEDDAYLSVSMSIPNGEGRTFLKQQLRWAGLVAGDSGTPPTSPQTIACPFPVAEGQKVYVEAKIIRADGRVSAPFRDTTAIAA